MSRINNQIDTQTAISRRSALKIMFMSLAFVACKPRDETDFSATPSIAAGDDHTLALMGDGSVWAWGRNQDGQVGNRGKRNSSKELTPVQVQGLSEIVAIAAGYYHSLALQKDGSVWAWGRNGYGQLGKRDGRNRYAPVQINSLESIAAIAAGGFHNLALDEDNAVWAWGDNIDGQLGKGTTSPVWIFEAENARPTNPLQLPDTILAVAAGGGHSLALDDNGYVWAWGSDNGGQLGDGFIKWDDPNVLLYDFTPQPEQVLDLTNITAIYAGGSQSFALRDDGTVWAWGKIDDALLGNGAGEKQSTPKQVDGLTGVVAIDIGGSHSLALRDDGTVWAWGNNERGQLGTEVVDSNIVQVPGLTDIVSIGAGFGHSVALQDNGTIWTWGRNNYGQLGDGTTTDRRTPIQVEWPDP